MGVSGSAFFWNALLFTRALRAAGISTDIGAAIDYGINKLDATLSGHSFIAEHRTALAETRRAKAPCRGMTTAVDHKFLPVEGP